MRFMMLMIPNVYQGANAEQLGTEFAPSPEAVAAMMKYNEDLAKAGVLVELDGLTPPNQAVRVEFPAGKATIVDGPFAESKEVIGGYWMIRVKTKEEAVEWAKRVPADAGDVIELRQVFEMEDFPAEVQKVADNASVREAIGR